jgi:undecaprenyl diphosphate synthase
LGPEALKISAKDPKHVAVIMDGNGRWARQRGLPRSRGHLEGANSARQCVEACLDIGIEYLTLYTFSTENWRRPKEEVDTLMGLLQRFLRDYTADLRKRSVKLEAIGRLQEIPPSVQCQLQESIRATAEGKNLTTILALNYSGRTEIVDATKKIVDEVMAGRLAKDDIDAEVFQKSLYTHSWPDPDLFIRTSGEMRISNFLLWQLSYTEIYVTQKLWPDFRKKDLIEAVQEYRRRNRRYGGI